MRARTYSRLLKTDAVQMGDRRLQVLVLMLWQKPRVAKVKRFIAFGTWSDLSVSPRNFCLKVILQPSPT